MKKLFPLLIVTVLASTIACSPKEEKAPTETDNTIPNFEGKDEIDAKIMAIDTNSALIIANSLSYQHPNGTTEEASAFLNEKEQIIKIEEKFKDGATGNFGRRLFYFEGNNRIATKEIFQDNARNPAVFVERVSYYKNDKVFFTEERTAEFEEQLEMNVFSVAKAVDCPKKTAMQILNQEGPFVTTFQGFSGEGQFEMLIVGENEEEGFTAGLNLQHSEGDIAKLKADQRAYVGKMLEVQFERVFDPHQSFEFTILLSAKIL